MGRSRSKSSPTGPLSEPPLVAHGWNIWFHPCVLDQLEQLSVAAERERMGGKKQVPGPNTKLLAHLWDLIADKVPRAPESDAYRQGNTLGKSFRHWRRAKTGNGRYRLFFRYRSETRTLVFAWVNDAESLRERGSHTDAYAVFEKRLRSGRPPDDWDQLLADCKENRQVHRARNVRSRRMPSS
jgi:toxin YhaV